MPGGKRFCPQICYSGLRPGIQSKQITPILGLSGVARIFVLRLLPQPSDSIAQIFSSLYILSALSINIASPKLKKR